MPDLPGVPIIEGSTLPAASRLPGDISQTLFVGPALRGPSDRVITITEPAEVAFRLGDPFGGSHLVRSLVGYFTEGGSVAHVVRAVDDTAATATADIDNAGGNPVLVVTADGPGAWGNDLTVTIANGVGSRKKFTIREDGIVKVETEAATAEEAAQRLTTPGIALVNVGAGAWPPANAASIALTGGVSADSAVTDTNIIDALSVFPASLGPGSIVAPGYTSQTVHEALMDHCRATSRFAFLDMPDVADETVVAALATQHRAYRDEKGARVAQNLYPWEVAPIGAYLNVPVPPSALQAGRYARTDHEDVQRQARAAAGPEITSRFSTAVTRTVTDAQWQTLLNAGVTVIKQEPEGVCAMDAITGVDTDRWPQYEFVAGARVRMAIVDAARAAVRPFLFRALDGQGIRLETIRGVVENVCKPFSQEPISGLFDQDGDGGYSVTIVSTQAELAAGKVRVQLALRTSPTIRQVVIEFTAVAIGNRV